MKKTILYTLAATMLAVSCKQQPDNTTTNTSTTKVNKTEVNATSPVADQMRQERIAYNRKIYDAAVANSDPYTQVTAIYGLMADDTSADKHYADTLASLYAHLSMVEPAKKLTDRILEKDPGNKKALELKAIISRSTGRPEEALNLSRKLYEQNKDLKYLFEIAELQFTQKNYKDLDQTIREIEKSPKLKTDKIEMQTEDPAHLQQVPAEAVLIYLKGVIAGQKKNYAEAKKLLQQAIEMYPGFVMAKYNLQAIESMSGGHK